MIVFSFLFISRLTIFSVRLQMLIAHRFLAIVARIVVFSIMVNGTGWIQDGVRILSGCRPCRCIRDIPATVVDGPSWFTQRRFSTFCANAIIFAVSIIHRNSTTFGLGCHWLMYESIAVTKQIEGISRIETIFCLDKCRRANSCTYVVESLFLFWYFFAPKLEQTKTKYVQMYSLN